MRAAKLNAVGWTAVFALCLGGLARAQTTTSADHWTVDSGETVGAGSNVLRGQVGFPGFAGDFIHGLDPTYRHRRAHLAELRRRGHDQRRYSAFEFKIELTLRKQFMDNGKLKLAGTFDPGFLLFIERRSPTGLTFPIGVQFGIPIDDKFTVERLVRHPVYGVTFGTSAVPLPLLFGGGVEYLLEPNLALTVQAEDGTGHRLRGLQLDQLRALRLFGVAYKM